MEVFDKILLGKIFRSRYWKEQCFALDAVSIIDRSADIKYVAGVEGTLQKPSLFLCLLQKMVQIAPDRDIVIDKYLTVLAMFYVRLVYKHKGSFEFIDPFLNDFRKIRVRDGADAVVLARIDEVADCLLTSEIYLGIVLPKLVRKELRKSLLLELQQSGSQQKQQIQ